MTQLAKEVGQREAASTDAALSGLYEQLRDDLEKRIPQLAKILPFPLEQTDHRDTWLWSDFLQIFQSVGGVIEAIPVDVNHCVAVDMFVFPAGQFEVLCTAQQSLCTETGEHSWLVPQTLISPQTLMQMCDRLATVCASKKLWGHTEWKLVAVSPSLFWATELQFFLSDRLNAFAFTDSIVNGKWDGEEYTLGTPRCIFISELYSHPALESLGDVYTFCNSEQIVNFDTRVRPVIVRHQ